MSAIRQLPQAISYCLMKPCYPLTYRKLQNFQTTVLDGKNWENAETVQLKDLRKTLRNCTVIGHTRFWRELTLEIGVAQFRTVLQKSRRNHRSCV